MAITILGRKLVKHARRPSDRLARKIRTQLQSYDLESFPEEDVVMFASGSQITPVRLCSCVLLEGRLMSPVNDYACLADAMGLLSEDDVDALIALYDPIDADGLRRQRIRRRALAGDFEEAHEIADQMEYPLYGHRDVGYHLAELGDHENFFAQWARYEPRRATKKLVELRERLMAGVGRHQGAMAAFELAKNHKRLGERYYQAALRSAQIAPYDELVPLLDEGELDKYVDEPLKCILLVDQLLRELPMSPEIEDPRVLPLAERIGRLDGDKGVRQIRDGRLFDLWSIIGDHSTLKRVRALIRTPNYRREMMRLASEVKGPADG